MFECSVVTGIGGTSFSKPPLRLRSGLPVGSARRIRHILLKVNPKSYRLGDAWCRNLDHFEVDEKNGRCDSHGDTDEESKKRKKPIE
jgi:hypothetical protein